MTTTSKVLRDAVHDFITFEGDEEPLLGVVDTYAFQRLRRVHQNGAGFLVYHGLEASRFGHALGTYEISKRVLSSLTRIQTETDLGPFAIQPHVATAFKAACLLHDLGHPCFSHLGERFFRTTSLSGETADPNEAPHETWTQRIILEDPSINALLSTQGWYPDLLSFIRGRHPIRYLQKLFSGNLDVDRFDYLNRDTRMSGTGYGLIDTDWLIRCMDVAVFDLGWNEPGPDLVFEASKGTFAVEHFLLSRRAMYAQIYFHKAVRAAEAVLISILLRAFDLGLYQTGGNAHLPEVFGRLALGDPSITVEDYLSLDDSHVLACISQWAGGKTSDPVLRDLCRRFTTRDLFKAVPIDEHTYLQFLQGEAREDNESRLKQVVRDTLTALPELDNDTRSLGDYYFVTDDCRTSIYEPGRPIFLSSRLPGNQRRFFPLETDSRIGQKFAEGYASENLFRQVFLIVPSEAHLAISQVVDGWRKAA